MDSKPFFAKQKSRKVFLYGKANTTELKVDVKEISSDFQKKELQNTDANDLWVEFANRLHTAENAHIPWSNLHTTPWTSQAIKCLHKCKQRAYNIRPEKEAHVQEDWDKYRDLRKLVKKESRKTIKTYTKYVNEKCLESVKQFWSLVKSLKKDSAGIPALKNTDWWTGHRQQRKANWLNLQYQSQFTQEPGL